MADYKEKIKKLLALAESPNEHEARAALLKARELMAEHKIQESELKNADRQEIKDILTGIYCSKRRDPWINLLANIIGPNYCCQAYMAHIKHKQTVQIGFVGLEDDAEICVGVFKYAVDCVRSYQNKRKKEYAVYDYSSEHIKHALEDYGTGFAWGVDDAFLRQMKTNESEWGLVMVVPQEVKHYTSGFGEKSITPQQPVALIEYLKGVKDGLEFDPKRRIQEEAVL